MTNTALEVLPQRSCYGCGQVDDHPRLHAIADIDNLAQEVLYHYDCAPKALLADQGIDETHPALAATAAGKRGADVRQAVLDSDLVPTEEATA